MASQQPVSKANTWQLPEVAAVSIFILKSCCWLSQNMNGKIMRKKNSLMWGVLYQNKGRENKKWHTFASEGLSTGRQVSVFSFKGKDKWPAVEKKMVNWGKGFKCKRTDSKKVWQAIGEIHELCSKRNRSIASLLCFQLSFISKKSFLPQILWH